VSGEATLSAENSGKPLGGLGSARTTLRSSQRSRDPLAGEEGAAARFPGILPALSAFRPWSCARE